MAVVNPSCDTSSGWALKGAHGVLQLKTLNRLSLNIFVNRNLYFSIYLKTYFLKGNGIVS
jgi:hypothetical protein